MNLLDIKITLDEIKNKTWDFEVAHSLEDDLMLNFIKHVAEHGDEELAEMATEVLKSQEIDFPRYCA